MKKVPAYLRCVWLCAPHLSHCVRAVHAGDCVCAKSARCIMLRKIQWLNMFLAKAVANIPGIIREGRNQ
jgi:hypothetical protein